MKEESHDRFKEVTNFLSTVRKNAQSFCFDLDPPWHRWGEWGVREASGNPDQMPFPLEGFAGELLLSESDTRTPHLPPTTDSPYPALFHLATAWGDREKRGSHFGNIDIWGRITFCFGGMSCSL